MLGVASRVEELLGVSQDLGRTILLNDWYQRWVGKNVRRHFRVAISPVTSSWQLIGAIHKLFGGAYANFNILYVFLAKVLMLIQIKLQWQLDIARGPIRQLLFLRSNCWNILRRVTSREQSILISSQLYVFSNFIWFLLCLLLGSWLLLDKRNVFWTIFFINFTLALNQFLNFSFLIWLYWFIVYHFYASLKLAFFEGKIFIFFLWRMHSRIFYIISTEDKFAEL